MTALDLGGGRIAPLKTCQRRSEIKSSIMDDVGIQNVVMSASPSETETTDMASDETTCSALGFWGFLPLERIWRSPYVPSRAGEWPDETFRKYWIGPFDMYRDTHAKEARQANWIEDDAIRDTRKLAESLYDTDDFVGARDAWTRIADHYISEYQHTSRWLCKQKGGVNHLYVLEHIVRSSIGCIINTYLAQYPDYYVTTKADDRNRSLSIDRPDRLFTAAVEFESGLTSSHALFTIRVMLDYASHVVCMRDYSWMRTIYTRALDAMGQIMDPNLHETIRLQQGLVVAIVESERKAYLDSINASRDMHTYSLRREQQEAHRIQNARIWRDEVEQLYLQIVANQQTLHGVDTETTIDSELELLKHYQDVGYTERAKARARQMYALAKDRFGEDHDSTLRCIAFISNLLLDVYDFEEAGSIVHECFKKHPDLMHGSLYTEYIAGDFVTQRGLKEMMRVMGRLERLHSPHDFVWADHRLYTLTIGTIVFTSRYPTATEQDSAWGLTCQKPKHDEDDKNIDNCLVDDAPGGSDDENLLCIDGHPKPPRRPCKDAGNFVPSLFEREDRLLDLQIPYIPYRHFMTTSEFEVGMPYLEYVKATDDRTTKFRGHDIARTHALVQSPVNGVEKKGDKKFNRLHDQDDGGDYVELELDDDPPNVQIQGFFNNIPSEAYISPELHVDLVTAKWADYQYSILHQLPHNATEIEIADGLSLPCYGYISGTWTDFGVCRQRMIRELFVVDATFLPKAVNSTAPMFVFRQETLQSSYHEVGNIEKRTFCARLNPSFYRYKPTSTLEFCSVYSRKKAKGTVTSTIASTGELTLWNEMNTREKWDRNFERRNPTDDADRMTLAEDLRAEDRRRETWDKEYQMRKQQDERNSPSEDSNTIVGMDAQQGSVGIGSLSATSASPDIEAKTEEGKESNEGGLFRKLRRLRLKKK